MAASLDSLRHGFYRAGSFQEIDEEKYFYYDENKDYNENEIDHQETV